jgi:hypothetical protein
MINILDLSQEITNQLDGLKYSKDPHTFSKVDIISEKEWKAILPEPPKNTSKSTKDELIEISKLTASRTKSDLDWIMMIDDKVESIFIPELNKLNLKYPKSTVDKLWNVYYDIVTNIKLYFNRARCWQLAPRYGITIDAIISDSSKTPSYPSGHSAYGYLLENILSDMYPIHKTLFASLAERVGLARKMQGVHYDSDVLAAKKLTNIVYPKLKTL